jgi:hypothetical protein
MNSAQQQSSPRSTLLCRTTGWAASVVFLLLWGADPRATTAGQPSFAIDWCTVDAGGGTATNSSFSISTTIGQPDAGTFTGSSHTIHGGFWGVVAVVQIPDAPTLEIGVAGNSIILMWPLEETGFEVEEISSLGQPAGWTGIPPPYETNATHNFYIVPLTTGNKYYRLNK